MRSPKRVGVRAMRQNVSRYLRRVASGETFEVTSRGRPVAVLAPLEPADTLIQRLAALGRATPPQGDLLELGVPPAPRRPGRVSAALRQQRAERL